MSEQTEELEDLICLAATTLGMLEGYLGPQWFDAVHSLKLEGPDKVAKAAGIIAARRSAMTAAEGRCPMSDVPVSLTAQSGTKLAHAIGRIKFLREPDTLNALLDGFQSLGMPMGSDRWAEYCLALLRELHEKERTLTRVQNALKDAAEATERCQGAIYRRRRQAMTKEFQDESARKERDAEAQFEALAASNAAEGGNR